ncbi:MAG: alpha-glucosidase [Clostridia bacterium]
MKKKWWQEAVGYEIYIRSFQDTNGDGIGDIQGIISRLPYLQALGVDMLWVTPFYQSPYDDMGYDISDYESVAPEFGTMADFEQLVQSAHQAGIKIVIDMVLNHTSDEHPWFIASKSSKDNPKADWYCWDDGKDGQPPNNWISAFEGSAWTYVPEREQYYLHQFSRKQPDLNWRNEEVVKEIFSMLSFWLDKGVDGLRLDVINSLLEDVELRDNYFIATGELVDYENTSDEIAFNPDIVQDNTRNHPDTFAMIRRMCKEVFEKYGDVFTVGECWPCTPAVADEIVGENGLSVAFNFDYHLLGKMEVANFKEIIRKWEASLEWRHTGSWNCYYLSNHDMPRQVSRFGSESERIESAKMLAAFLLTAPGTIFLYQGEELGMTDVRFPNIKGYQDIQCVNLYKRLVESGKPEAEAFAEIQKMSRDNARTPMQWDSSKHAGFTTGKPWLDVNNNYQELNVALAEAEEDSVLAAYKSLIKLRKQYKTLVYGSYEELFPEHEQLLIVQRKDEVATLITIINLTGEIANLPELPFKLADAKNLYPKESVVKSIIPPFAAYVMEL